ncbi:MAG: pyruvate dehydrogenase (acetyl-transferring), homodimeric type [Acidobacteriota bacterium]
MARSPKASEPSLQHPEHALAQQDVDPLETREWLESLESVLQADGGERAAYLIARLDEYARERGFDLSPHAATGYVNTIPPQRQPGFPGDIELEESLLRRLRWNAMAMVVKSNKKYSGLGGHIATYASVAHLFEMGFNHFWRARNEERGQLEDLIYFQGHASPGIYARAFLEGRLDEEHLDRFRREVERPGDDEQRFGLSSYPHSWLMPDFWQFATVSMGLGPLMAIYQARFMKYLHRRGLQDLADRKVWAFLGDGETDEPESLGALGIAVREGLDNLVFVINCNLQRLDGPVRGNGKIIQELEAAFRGVGWNVIKVLWNSAWDELFAKDTSGALRRRMMSAVDGEYQHFNVHGIRYLREEFFGASEELRQLIDGWSDEDLARLGFGGHDAEKIYAAFRAASEHRGRPTVILAKTVKGYGLGAVGQGQNTTHQLKKLEEDDLRHFRQHFQVPVSDEELPDLPFLQLDPASAEKNYLDQHREALGGSLPARHEIQETLPVPELDTFAALLKDTGERELSTTMAFVRFLSLLLRQAELKERIVPIVADEARTFGMEGLFRQLGIYSPVGQLYTPVDKSTLAYYRETDSGQVLQEGITEAGAMSTWIAAATSSANHAVTMVPFFIFYSMFGFQRIGDLAWAGADMRARGFLLGATSGRTTLNGEGLQHEDGHSHLIAATVPTCRAYDPTYTYELAVILRRGMVHMYVENEPVFYYITVLNENYPHPALPQSSGVDGASVEEAIVHGLYRLRASKKRSKTKRVQLLGCGSILREVEAAAQILEQDHGIAADVWSSPGLTELRRDGLAVDRWNRLHPTEEPRSSWVERCLEGTSGPVIAATDYTHAYPDQIRPWVPRRFVTLGTDGFGRSDTRETLRSFFEVDRHHIVVAALKALADEGTVPAKAAAKAIESYGIDPEATPPTDA